MARRSRPIEISFAANVRDFLRKMRGVEDSVDEVAESLDDAAKDADGFERDFTSAMKDAERAAERAGRDIGDSFDKVDDQFGEVGGEAGQEFKQNLAESLSSGDVDSIVQDTLGGLISGLSGAAAGAATAVAGTALLVFNSIQEEAEKVQALVDSTVEGVRTMYSVLDQEWTQAKENARVAQFLEDNDKLIQETKANLAELGIDYEDFWLSMATGAGGYEGVLQEIIKEEEANLSASKKTEGTTTRRLTLAQILLHLYEEQSVAGQEALSVAVATQDVYNQHLASTGQLTPRMQANVDKAQERLDAELEVLAAQGHVIDAQGDITAQIEGSTDEARRLRDQLDLATQRRVVWLDFQITGNGAAYLDRSNPNYSPGHVAINNIHTGG